MSGLNKKIVLSFMLAGHTKFTPDSCFGMMKQRLRHTRIDCLDDVVKAINSSAVVDYNKKVGNEDGSVLVPTYQWLNYFTAYFTTVPGIKQYHQFIFSSEFPGVVRCKQFSDSATFTTVCLIKDHQNLPPSTTLPPVAEPAGLSSDRQWYLYNKIRPFCLDRAMDTICPCPSIPPPAATHTSTCESATQSPPAKRSRFCSNCGLPGHNRRSCSSN